MRELIRSADGEITRAEFRRGAGFLLALTVAVFVFLYGIGRLSKAMDWMTVMVAPFFGAVVLIVGCSLIYFWYCLFAKRSRALGYSLMLVHAWLFAIFGGSALRLLDYQNRTMGLADSGLLTMAGFGALALSILSVGLYVLLIWRCWR